MKNQLRLGLIVEGNATGSTVLKLKNLVDEMGPVKSTGLQIARRFSNILRAGYAVAEYKELQAARLILIRLPDSAVPRVVEELCASGLRFEDLSFVLCESWLLTEVLDPLRERGALTASFVKAPGREPSDICFVVEGHLTAVRQVRRLLERGGARTVEVRTGTKPRYFAAQLLITALPLPLFQEAQQALRDSGVSGNDLAALIEGMTHELFSAFLKGGRAEWGGPLTECTPQTASRYFEELALQDPELAETAARWLEWGRERMAKKAHGHSA